MNKIQILNMLYFSGIISSLISIVTINLSNVEAQWIETPPRYTCPKGKFHIDDAYQNTYCNIRLVHMTICMNIISFNYERSAVISLQLLWIE